MEWTARCLVHNTRLYVVYSGWIEKSVWRELRYKKVVRYNSKAERGKPSLLLIIDISFLLILQLALF